MSRPAPAPAASGVAAASGLGGARLCPECLASFPARHPRGMFCSDAHKRAWANRATVRGARLFAYAAAARETRDGSRGDRSTGAESARLRNILLQRWRDEDRAAGRMSQVDYVRRRLALGFCEL